MPRLLPRLSLLALLVMPLHASWAGDEKKDMDDKLYLQVDFSEGMDFGLAAVDKNGNKKRITFSEQGDSNITLIRIGQEDKVFGNEDDGDFNPKQMELGKGRHGSKCTWVTGKIHVTQIVEIVRSQTGKLDTCLVTWTIDNKDNKAHEVGIRPIIDTCLGDNDAVPFQVVGKKERITTKADFKGKEVPDSIRAFESINPKRAGLEVQFSLKVGGKHEAPDRVVLTDMPNNPENWEIPVNNIEDDSGVALYWNPKEIPAGGSRTVGFAIGLGVVNLDKKDAAEKK